MSAFFILITELLYKTDFSVSFFIPIDLLFLATNF